MGILLLTALVTARAACPDAADAVDAAEQAVLRGKFDDAQGHMDLAVEAFGCGPLADAALLGRLWRAEGAMLWLSGDETAATEALWSARRVDPGTWTDAFGDELKAKWSTATMDGEGTVSVEGEAELVALDGVPASFPATAPAGLHLVQAGQDRDAMGAAQVVLLSGTTGENVVASLRIAPSLAQSEDIPARERKPALLVAGGSAGLLAGGSALMAKRQDGAMADATTTPELDREFGKQKVYAYSSYGLAGLAAAGLGLYFVF